jgi:dTDP-4-dehydrorhamnose 3,5-epimerase
MQFIQTKIERTYVVEMKPVKDDRGHFARTWCARTFAEHGLESSLRQCNVSHNRHRGILRGMHFQRAPHGEAKLVRCTRGAIYDVVIDLRPQSSSYLTWIAEELTADGTRMLFIPPGCAHGFQTLRDDTEVFYQMSAEYHPESATGVRFDDQAFAIDWPIANPLVSERDRSWPDYRNLC